MWVKKIIALLLALTIFIISNSVFAFEMVGDVRAIPADSQVNSEGVSYPIAGKYATDYAPWLKNLHLMSETESEDADIFGGEGCQQVEQLEISPADTDVMYFITNTSGIYTTKNGGKSWYNTNNNARGYFGRGLLCDPDDKNVVYASFYKDGFYRSKDGGKNWELFKKDLDGKNNSVTNTFAMDGNGTLYFACSEGIYKLENAATANDGLELIYDCSGLEAVTEIKDKGPAWTDIRVSADGKNIYASVEYSSSSNAHPGIYYSKDGGENWVCPSTATKWVQSVTSIALHPENEDEIYFSGYKYNRADLTGTIELTTAGTAPNGMQTESVATDLTDTNYNGYGIYKTENIESSVALKYKNTSNNGLPIEMLKFGAKESDGEYPLYFSFSTKDKPLYYSKTYRTEAVTVVPVVGSSINLGAGTIRNWENGYFSQGFCPDPEVAERIVFASSGIYEKNQGAFKRISGGFSGADVVYVDYNSEGEMLFAVTDLGLATSEGVYKENTDGTYSYPTFEFCGDDYTTMAVFDPRDESKAIVALGTNNGSNLSQNGFVYGLRVFDIDTQTYESVIECSKLGEEDYSRKTSFIEFIKNSDGEYSNIYTSYHKYNIDLTEATGWKNGDTELFVWITEDNGKTLIATENTEIVDTIYKSSDGGATWETVSLSTETSINQAAFDLRDPNYMFISKLFRFGRVNLTTGKLEWFANIPGANTFSVFEQNPTNPEHIIVATRTGFAEWGTDNKLSETYDGGKSWHTVPGLWGSYVTCLSFLPDSSEVLIGSMSGTLIYDYNKFNYYQCVVMQYEGCENEILTLPRIDINGNNVNNGTYFLAPENPFFIYGKNFIGWDYKGIKYNTGEKISIN